MTWATDRRLDYIDLLLLMQGQVRRADLMEAFGVSMQQASADIQAFLEAYPDAMGYDKSAKCYVRGTGRYQAQRTTPATRAALRTLTKASI